jgi:hypothetical protein
MKKASFVVMYMIHGEQGCDTEIDWATMGLVLHAVNMDRTFP